MAWEGISNTMADSAYNQLANDIGKHGKSLEFIMCLLICSISLLDNALNYLVVGCVIEKRN